MERKWKYAGTARAAAALIGLRIAAGGREGREREQDDPTPPDWLAQLDDRASEDELWRALYASLDEVHDARIGLRTRAGSGHPACGRNYARRRRAHRVAAPCGDLTQQRRSVCPHTTR